MPQIWTYPSSQLPWRSARYHPAKPLKRRSLFCPKDALAAILSAPPDTKFGVRDRAILILLYDTAVRVSELLNIRLCDITAETKHPNIFITGKGNKERTIQLTAKAAGHLKEYMRVYHSNSSKEAYLFSTTIKGVTDRMSVGNVQRIIKKYAALVSEAGSAFQIQSIATCSGGPGPQIFTRMGSPLNLSLQC